MRPEQIALTLYTLRDHCQDVTSLRSTLKKVKEIGYSAIQISGVGVQDPNIIRELAEEVGLIICATHEPSHKILEEPAEVVERLNMLGCTHTAFPHPGSYAIDSMEACLVLANKLESAGKILRDGGKQLSYHNQFLIQWYKYGQCVSLFDNRAWIFVCEFLYSAIYVCSYMVRLISNSWIDCDYDITFVHHCSLLVINFYNLSCHHCA